MHGGEGSGFVAVGAAVEQLPSKTPSGAFRFIQKIENFEHLQEDLNPTCFCLSQALRFIDALGYHGNVKPNRSSVRGGGGGI